MTFGNRFSGFDINKNYISERNQQNNKKKAYKNPRDNRNKLCVYHITYPIILYYTILII